MRVRLCVNRPLRQEKPPTEKNKGLVSLRGLGAEKYWLGVRSDVIRGRNKCGEINDYLASGGTFAYNNRNLPLTFICWLADVFEIRQYGKKVIERLAPKRDNIFPATSPTFMTLIAMTGVQSHLKVWVPTNHRTKIYSKQKRAGGLCP